MPINDITSGYDKLISYSSAEISRMHGNKIPEKQALALSREMRKINRAEQRLWDKVRRYEIQADRLSLLVS